MIRLIIEPQLQTHWEPILTDKLNLFLSTVLLKIKIADIHFRMHQDPASKVSYYCCEFRGHGARNEKFDAYTQNSDGKIAISDAFSCIRRTIIRKKESARFFAHENFTTFN